MTLIRFEYKVGDSGGAPIVLLSPEKGREIIDTTAGRALTDTLRTIELEPGHGWTMWAEPAEDAHTVLVFTGWEDKPPPALASTAAYRRLDPSTSPLSALTPHLRFPPTISLLPLRDLVKVPLANPACGPWSLEMVTWTFPPHLDPTSHPAHAATFKRADTRLRIDPSPFLGRGEDWSSVRLHGIQRAWVAPPATPSGEGAPSERTHVYLFLWANRNAELVVKREESEVGRERREMGMGWGEIFGEPEAEWERSGMVARSVHLETHVFAISDCGGRGEGAL